MINVKRARRLTSVLWAAYLLLCAGAGFVVGSALVRLLR